MIWRSGLTLNGMETSSCRIRKIHKFPAPVLSAIWATFVDLQKDQSERFKTKHQKKQKQIESKRRKKTKEKIKS